MGAPSVNWVNNYSNELLQLLQKNGSVWMPGLDMDFDFQGEYKFYNQLSETIVNQRVSRNEDTIYNEADHRRRRMSKELYTSAMLFDTWDEINMNLDPTSGYTHAQLMAMGRKIDDIARTAALGIAYTGKNGSTATSFDSGQVVTAASGLTYEKILEVLELFNENNVSTIEDKYFTIGPKQLTAMLKEAEITSSDFVGGLYPLMEGKVGKYAGFKFILDTELNLDGTDRQCVAWSKTGLKFGVSRSIGVRVDELPQKNYSKQIFTEMAVGSVRMEEGKVVRIDVSEA